MSTLTQRSEDSAYKGLAVSQGSPLLRFQSFQNPLPIRCHFRIAHGVLDIAMPEPHLQRACVMACIRQRVAQACRSMLFFWIEAYFSLRAEASSQKAGKYWFASAGIIGTAK